MDSEDKFTKIWSRVSELEIPEEEEAENPLCEYAQGFSAWTNHLFNFLEEPNIVKINQVKIMLQDRYFDMYHYVPRSHRYKASPTGHTCIFQVYENTYEKIHIIELTLMPPLLFDVEHFPKPLPPNQEIGGIFLGEGS